MRQTAAISGTTTAAGERDERTSGRRGGVLRASAYVDRGSLSAYADTMIITAELARDVGSHDPSQGLRAVAALRRLVEQLEALQVDRARSLGWSWQDIAGELGVSKQTVHRKHVRRLRG